MAAILLALSSILIASLPGSVGRYARPFSIVLPTLAAIFATLLAAGVVRARGDAVRLIYAIAVLEFNVSILRFVWSLAAGRGEDMQMIIEWAFMLWPPTATGVLIWRAFPRLAKARRLFAAILLVISCVIVGSPYQAMAAVESWIDESGPAAENSDPNITYELDRLFEAQPALIDDVLAGLDRRATLRNRTFVVGIAASGAQRLFSTEARLATMEFGKMFEAPPGDQVLLSNGERDLFQAPLATNGAIDRVLAGIGKIADPAEDMIVVYLASRGGRDARLLTVLPGHDRLESISAEALAIALRKTRIRQRIVVISGCFAGSWIPALRDDHTIVIAAAAADRTSFGCTDERRLTYFGEAFLEQAGRQPQSLAERFARARRVIAGWERKDDVDPSRPQVFVGQRMAKQWMAPRPLAR